MNLLNINLISFKTEIISTIILLFSFISFYQLVSFFTRKQEFSTEKAHRTLVNTRNTLTFIFIICVTFVWIGEIKTSLLSAAAICSAVIITFKELILSFFGTILSNQNFQLGDYIETENNTGRIVNKTFLNTTILINDTYQTQELIIPNINFLTTKIKKLSKIPKVQFCSFSISVDSIKNVYKYSEIAKEISFNIIQKYNPDYESYLKEIEQITPYFDVPVNIVDIGYEVSDNRKLQFIISFLCKPSQTSLIKNDILKIYLEKIQD